MFDHYYTRPVPYHCFNGIKDGEASRTGLFNLFASHELTGLFSSYEFWSDLTAAILDHYLNVFLSSNQIVDGLARYIHFDRDNSVWVIDDNAPLEAFASALAGKFTETEATFLVMTQQNLNIVEFTDIDRNVYGARSATRNYDKVEIDVTNGQTVLTDVLGARSFSHVIADRTNIRGGGTDTDTKGIAGFNSSSFNDADRNTRVEAQRTDTIGGGTDTDTEATTTDTHTTGQSQDNTTTKARQDTEAFATYTDVLNHTKHIVLSPDAYFAIQKEMADYNLYASVMDAVKGTICKGVW